MRNFNKLVLGLAIALAAVPAFAGNDNGPTFFGDTTNNNQTYNQPVANGGAGYGGDGGTGVGVGIGVGTGGSATATGGNSNSTAFGGSVGDIRNTNTALGGAGGSVVGSGNSHNDNTNIAVGGSGGKGGTGIGLGGSAAQGQQQGQGQHQSNVGVNTQGQSNSNTSSTSTATNTATSTKTNQSQSASSNQGQSQSANNAGNSQSVGGQSVTINEADIPDDVTVRQAPSMMAVAPNATISCYKTFGGTLSGIIGGAGFSGGKLDQSCEHRELVRLTAAVDPSGAIKVLCLNQMYNITNATKCAGIAPVILMDGQVGRQYKANTAK